MFSKKIFFSIFIVLISFGFCYAGELFYEEVLNNYNEGVRAQKRNDFRQAMTGYQKALLLMGTAELNYKKSIFNNIGVLYAERGNLEDAQTAFIEALKIDPSYKQANFNLGIIYVKLGKTKEALKYLQKMSGRTDIFIVEEEKRLEELEKE